MSGNATVRVRVRFRVGARVRFRVGVTFRVKVKDGYKLKGLGSPRLAFPDITP